MTSGDYYHIVVATPTVLKCAKWNPVAVDGSQRPFGVLLNAVDATSVDASGVAIVRNAEVSANKLIYDATVALSQTYDAHKHMSFNSLIVRY
jgi:hypothetical protein